MERSVERPTLAPREKLSRGNRARRLRPSPASRAATEKRPAPDQGARPPAYALIQAEPCRAFFARTAPPLVRSMSGHVASLKTARSGGPVLSSGAGFELPAPGDGAPGGRRLPAYFAVRIAAASAAAETATFQGATAYALPTVNKKKGEKKENELVLKASPAQAC